MVKFLLNEFQKNIDSKLCEGEADEFLSLLDEGVVVLDNFLKITYVNKKALSLLYKNQEIDKNNFLVCKKLAIQALRKTQTVKKTIKDIKSDVVFEVSAVPRKKKNGMFIIFKDKTAEYKMMKVGKDFVANASHELRTPLTIIKGYVETLNEYSNLDESIIREIIEKLVNTSLRLENVIYDLLLLADIENMQATSFKKCDIKQVIKNAKTLILQSHKDISIELDLLELDLPMYINGASGLLEIALKNILENAIKYSDKPPKIKLSLKKEEGFFRITIEDNGIGIPSKDLPYIFNRFFTVDKARSRKQGGAGLGLSLVKNIIEKHGGDIDVSSKEDQGTTFSISFSK